MLKSDMATVYKVQHGDHLIKIVRDHYGTGPFLGNRALVLERVAQFNPHIPNIDRIFPGQLIVLPDMAPQKLEISPATASQAAACRTVVCELDAAGPVAQDIFADLAANKTLSAALNGGGGVYGAFGKAARDAVSDVKTLESLYAQYKAGAWTKGQYSGRRIKVINAMDKNLGAFRSFAFQANPLDKPNGSRQILRFSTSGKGPTGDMIAGTARLSKAVTRLRVSGGILTVASVAASAVQYHGAKTDREKVAILTDGAGSLLGGIAAGFMVAAVFTPVGWVGIAGVAVAGIAGGSLGGYAAKSLGDWALFDKDGAARVELPLP